MLVERKDETDLLNGLLEAEYRAQALLEFMQCLVERAIAAGMCFDTVRESETTPVRHLRLLKDE